MVADGLYNHSEVLYNVTGKTATHTGDAYEIQPVKRGEVSQASLTIEAFCVVTTSGGASSPTADLTIETSADGTNWYTWGGITQVTTATTSVQLVSTTTKVFFQYVRAKLTLGGGTAPTTSAQVRLVSNGRFNLVAV